MYVAALHVLEGCLSAGDLEELNEEQHRYPGKLKTAESDYYEGEGVFVECLTGAWVDELKAMRGSRGGESFEI